MLWDFSWFLSFVFNCYNMVICLRIFFVCIHIYALFSYMLVTYTISLDQSLLN